MQKKPNKQAEWCSRSRYDERSNLDDQEAEPTGFDVSTLTAKEMYEEGQTYEHCAEMDEFNARQCYVAAAALNYGPAQSPATNSQRAARLPRRRTVRGCQHPRLLACGLTARTHAQRHVLLPASALPTQIQRNRNLEDVS